MTSQVNDFTTIQLGASALCSADLSKSIEAQRKIRELARDQQINNLILGEEVYKMTGEAIANAGNDEANAYAAKADGLRFGASSQLGATGASIGTSLYRPNWKLSGAKDTFEKSEKCKDYLHDVNTAHIPGGNVKLNGRFGNANNSLIGTRDFKFGNGHRTDNDLAKIDFEVANGRGQNLKDLIKAEKSGYDRELRRWDANKKVLADGMQGVGQASNSLCQATGENNAANETRLKAQEEKKRAVYQFTTDSARTQQDAYSKQAEDAKGNIQQTMSAFDVLAQMSRPA